MPLSDNVAAALNVAASSAGVGWPTDPADPTLLGYLHQFFLDRRIEANGQSIVVARKARKAAGAFYTPASLREFAVGRAVDGQTKTALDPSCGCGWFLITLARQMQTAEGIFGCDLDSQAVEAARRAVWLELLRGRPHDAATSNELARALVRQLRACDALAELPADWPERFDAVVGNPPYRRELGNREAMQRLAQTPLGRKYGAPRMDLWYYFAHRSLELLRPGGRFSMIVGDYWTAGHGAAKWIAALRESAHVDEIVCLDRTDLFPGVSAKQMILTVTNARADTPTTILKPDDEYQKTAEQLFRRGRIDLEPANDALLDRLERWPALGTLGDVRQGIAENPAAISPRVNRAHGGRWRNGEGVFSLSPEEDAALDWTPRERSLLRPYHDLCDLGRYRLVDPPSRVLIYSTAETAPDLESLPNVAAHLARFRPILDARRETAHGQRAWWQLHWPRDERIWLAPKVIVVQMASRPSAAGAIRPVYVPFSANVFVPATETREHVLYFTALLNSRALAEWFRHHAKRRGVGLEINGKVLAAAPIRRIDFEDPADRATHDRLVELAAEMAKSPSQETDQAIDQLVDRLYGLEGL